MQKGLFDLLKQEIGCDYISDLRFEPYKSIARKKLKCCEFDGCSLKELNDITHYLFEVSPFSAKDAAVAFLKSQ